MGVSASQPQAAHQGNAGGSANSAGVNNSTTSSNDPPKQRPWQHLCPSLVRLVSQEPVPVTERDFWLRQLTDLEKELSELQPDVLADVILTSCARLATNHPFSENLRALIAVATDELLMVLAEVSLGTSSSFSSTSSQSLPSSHFASPDEKNPTSIARQELLAARVDRLLALLFLCRVFTQYLLAVCPAEHQRRHFDILNSPLASASTSAFVTHAIRSCPSHSGFDDTPTNAADSSCLDLESGTSISGLSGTPASQTSSPSSTSTSGGGLLGWFSRRQAISVDEPITAAHDSSSNSVGFSNGGGGVAIPDPDREEQLLLASLHSLPGSPSAAQSQADLRLELLFRAGGLLEAFVEATVRVSVELPATEGPLVDLKVELLNVLLVLLSSQMYSDPEDAENSLRFFRMLPANMATELVPRLLRQFALGEETTLASSPAQSSPGLSTESQGSRSSAGASHHSSERTVPSSSLAATGPSTTTPPNSGGMRSTLKRAARGAVVTAVTLLLWPLRLPVRLFRLLFRADEVAVQALSRRSLMLLVILVNQTAFPEYRRALGSIADSDRLMLFSGRSGLPSSSPTFAPAPLPSPPPPLTVADEELKDASLGTSASAGSFSFDLLYGMFCRSIREHEPDLLLLYSMLVSNSGFREYVLARSDIDLLIVPLLQRLYQDSSVGRDPAAPGYGDPFDDDGGNSGGLEPPDSSTGDDSLGGGTAAVDSEELEARRRHVYVLLIVLLLLSEDVAFCESAHSRVFVSPAAIRGWLNRERSPAAASLLSGSGSGGLGGGSKLPDFLGRSRSGSLHQPLHSSLDEDDDESPASISRGRVGGFGLRLLALPFEAISNLLNTGRGSNSENRLPLPGGGTPSRGSGGIGSTRGGGGGSILSRIKTQGGGGASNSGSGTGGCSLGSLMFVVLLRMLALNLTHDQYIHSNCVGVLSNLARHTSGLHPYAAHRLVRLLQLLARRFLRVAVPPPPLHHLKSGRSSRHGRPRSDSERWEEEERAAALREGPSPEVYYQKRLEAAREADGIITAALRIVTDSLGARHIASNSFLVYELLYNRGTAIEPFRSHRRYWGKVEQLCAIVYHFNTCVNEAIERPDNTMESVLAAVHHAAVLWRADVLVGGAGGSCAVASNEDDEGEGGASRFRYQEAPDSAAEFFLPYIWSLIYRNQVVPFFPAEAHDQGQQLEAAEQQELAEAVLGGGPGDQEEEMDTGGGVGGGVLGPAPPGGSFGQPWVLPVRPPGPPVM